MSSTGTPPRHRIAFVLPWFGPWPIWMPLTWESCRCNPDVDWLVFSDQPRTPEMPGNVKHFPTSFADFHAELSAGLGMSEKLPPRNAYKLCDFKPTYGAALPQRLEGYDFWGMCDLDLIWGQIRTFYTDRLLSEFDILTSERCCMNGQCTLFRNAPAANNIFRLIPEADLRLGNEIYCGMDEMLLDEASRTAEKKGIIRTLRRRLNVHQKWNAWDEWAERLELEETGSLENLPRLAGASHWKAGRVFHNDSGAEMVLFHFANEKKTLSLQARCYPFWRNSMMGMDLGLDSIRMIFSPGHLFAKIRYYFVSRFAARFRYWLAHPVRDTMNIVKGRFPRLVPAYQKMRGFDQPSQTARISPK
jgi:hypothetical protein